MVIRKEEKHWRNKGRQRENNKVWVFAEEKRERKTRETNESNTKKNVKYTNQNQITLKRQGEGK